MKKRFPLALTSAILFVATVGCSNPAGTSDDFKPPPAVSKADVQKQIDSVTADTKIPAGQKQMVLDNLKKKLDNAK